MKIVPDLTVLKGGSGQTPIAWNQLILFANIVSFSKIFFLLNIILF